MFADFTKKQAVKFFGLFAATAMTACSPAMAHDEPVTDPAALLAELDFVDDGTLDVADVNDICQKVIDHPGPLPPQSNLVQYDLNGDSILDKFDVYEWLHRSSHHGNHFRKFSDHVALEPGDADLDGFGDADDLIGWDKYKFGSAPTGIAWTAGDFNVDGTVDGLDFIIWNDNKD